MNKNTIKGMKDRLPRETAIRNTVMEVTREEAKARGFSEIEIPAMELAENLSGSEGGDNLALIYRVLKRSDKLDAACAAIAGNTGSEQDDARKKAENLLSFAGLRYDLTLPLVRFYANNLNDLGGGSIPFRSFQTGRVYRAEQPGRGRLREFVQCDYDILGGNEGTDESEILCTLLSVLTRLGFEDLEVKLNDRRIVDAVAGKLGVDEGYKERFLRALDKMDKVGLEGTFATTREYVAADKTNELYKFLAGKTLCGIDGGREMNPIMEMVDFVLERIELQFENNISAKLVPTLVRGQGYYTGMVYEIAAGDANGKPIGSIAGGGRYDKMGEKMTGGKMSVPAAGGSIGFERVCSLIAEREDGGQSLMDGEKKTICVIYDDDDVETAMDEADRLRACEYSAFVQKRKKNLGKQAKALSETGCADGMFVCGRASEVEWF